MLFQPTETVLSQSLVMIVNAFGPRIKIRVRVVHVYTIDAQRSRVAFWNNSDKKGQSR